MLPAAGIKKMPVPPAGILFPGIIPFAQRAFALQNPHSSEDFYHLKKYFLLSFATSFRPFFCFIVITKVKISAEYICGNPVSNLPFWFWFRQNIPGFFILLLSLSIFFVITQRISLFNKGVNFGFNSWIFEFFHSAILLHWKY